MGGGHTPHMGSVPPPPVPPFSAGPGGTGSATPGGPEAGGATPGVPEAEAQLVQNWVHVRAVVRVTKPGDTLGCTGVVTHIAAGRMCRIDVIEPASMGVIEVREKHLRPVLPQELDRVLIVGSNADRDLCGKQGTLNNVDDNDAVVTVDEQGLQFFEIHELCKLMPERRAGETL